MAVPSDSEEFRKQFEEGRTKSIPEELARFEWLHSLEESFDAGHLFIGTTAGYLYNQAAWCYILGLHAPCVMMAGAATEAWLRAVTDAPRGGLKRLIDLAAERGRISKPLAERLHRMRESMRNPVAHGHDAVLFALGMTKVGEATWVAPEGSDAGLSDAASAREAIETFFRFVRETLVETPR